MNVELLGTSGCHLCEVAERLVRRIAPNLGANIQHIDIASDDALVDAYGMKIPVLRTQEGKTSELNWPFDEESLIAWLTSNQ